MHTATRNVYRERINFAKTHTSIPIPNLIEIQRKSYERFLQMRVLPQDREEAGLQSVFKSVFPIADLRENCSLAPLRSSPTPAGTGRSTARSAGT